MKTTEEREKLVRAVCTAASEAHAANYRAAGYKAGTTESQAAQASDLALEKAKRKLREFDRVSGQTGSCPRATSEG